MRFPCSNCGALVRPGSAVCHSCKQETGAKIGQHNSSAPEAPAPADSYSSVNGLSERKCPFCAETIKSEAVKCRFCGSDLKSGQPKPSADIRERLQLGGAIALMVVGFGAAWMLGQKPARSPESIEQTAPAPNSHQMSAITGSAFLNRSGGDSEILRGMTVLLCKPEALSSVPTESQQYLDQAHSMAAAGTEAFDSLQRCIDKCVRPEILASTKTDIGGNFKFDSVPKGTTQATNDSYANWLLAISTSASNNSEVQLDNSNASNIINLQQLDGSNEQDLQKESIALKQAEAWAEEDKAEAVQELQDLQNRRAKADSKDE